MRVCGKWLHERMQIYSSGAALAAHMPDLIPEHAVHALIGRCAETFTNPEKVTEDIAQCARRLPPQETRLLENRALSPALGCLEVLANSILWNPFGMQWIRNGHWPFLKTYGTKRYRSEGCSSSALPLPKPKQKTKEAKVGTKKASSMLRWLQTRRNTHRTQAVLPEAKMSLCISYQTYKHSACGIKPVGRGTHSDHAASRSGD